MTALSPDQLDALKRARYKLRQADLALGHLRRIPAEIATDLRQARAIGHPDLRLDTFFFSCLGLAKSAYYIIADDRYKDAIHSWRMSALDLGGRTHFNRMMNLRDIDVHQGRSDGQTLATMIPMEPGGTADGWRHQQRPNYAALGIRPPVTEHKNPDGQTVSSYDGLQGTMCLYITISGKSCEASNACEQFIAQLTSLMDALEAAKVPPLGRLQRFWRWLRITTRCNGRDG